MKAYRIDAEAYDPKKDNLYKCYTEIMALSSEDAEKQMVQMIESIGNWVCDIKVKTIGE